MHWRYCREVEQFDLTAAFQRPGPWPLAVDWPPGALAALLSAPVGRWAGAGGFEAVQLRAHGLAPAAATQSKVY